MIEFSSSSICSLIASAFISSSTAGVPHPPALPAPPTPLGMESSSVSSGSSTPLGAPPPEVPPETPGIESSMASSSSPSTSSRPIIFVIRFIKKSSIEMSFASPSRPATLASSASLNFPSPSVSSISNTLSAPQASIKAWNAGDFEAIFSNSSRSAPTKSSVFNEEPSAFVSLSSSVGFVSPGF